MTIDDISQRRSWFFTLIIDDKCFSFSCSEDKSKDFVEIEYKNKSYAMGWRVPSFALEHFDKVIEKLKEDMKELVISNKIEELRKENMENGTTEFN